MKAKALLTTIAAVMFAGAPVLMAAEDSEGSTKEKARDTVQRSSILTGMSVRNAENEDLGEVNDIVIDVTTGDVHYLAISYGGILGIGDKLFAVPVDAFRLGQDEGSDSYHLVLPVDEITLKKAPGFDQDQWPNFADKSWSDKINKHYEKYLHHQGTSGSAEFNLEVGDVDVSVDLNADRDDAASDVAENDRAEKAVAENTIHRISELTGTTVENKSSKAIGEVYDFVIDLPRGKVNYVAISHGGILGVGDKLFAVSFDEIECRQCEDGEYFLVVDMDEEAIENSPGLDQDNWPDFAVVR